MKKRIFASIASVTLISIFIFNILLSNILYSNFLNSQINSINQELNHIEMLLNNQISSISSIVSANRVSLFDENGNVIFDNTYNPLQMSNHSDRTEFSSALQYGFGQDKRNSETLGTESYYFATLLNDGSVLRISFESSTIFTILLKNSAFILFISCIFLFLALLATKYLTDFIVKPINIESTQHYDELIPFFKTIEKQKMYISQQKQSLEQKITEFDAIVGNIGDGLILLNSKETIISINKKALETLGRQNVSYIGKNIIDLTRIIDITSAITSCYNGNFIDEIIHIKNKVFAFKLSPVFVKNSVVGIVILIIDSTKNHEIENIRREFSANVSHELRTPLTSISGYAELMKSGFVAESDIIPFAENIYNEASILINLIEDIIKISRLDENITEFEYSQISLNEMINSIISRLDVQLKSRNISMTVNLDEISVYGVPQILQESFYNIIQNAIKYNKPNGNVSISTEKCDKHHIITIKDTGIGIPKNLIHRIFERFYRVDTSHSKTISGTGLGLAIAKHGITFHDGKIEVFSEETVSTTFKIYLKH